MRQEPLPDGHQSIITNALYTATQEYAKYAIDPRLPERLRDAFRKQADDAGKLAEVIEQVVQLIAVYE